MTVQEVRREEGAEPWPRLRDLAELEEVVVMDLRRGSVDDRWVCRGLSDAGRIVDIVEVWSVRSRPARPCLGRRWLLWAVLHLRTVVCSSSTGPMRKVSSKALSVRFMVATKKEILEKDI